MTDTVFKGAASPEGDMIGINAQNFKYGMWVN